MDPRLRHHLRASGQEDDILIGVKSTALKLGASTKPWLAAFYGGATALLALAARSRVLSWPFYAVLAGVAAHFCWQVTSLDLNDPKDCLAKFKSTRR